MERDVIVIALELSSFSSPLSSDGVEMEHGVIVSVVTSSMLAFLDISSSSSSASLESNDCDRLTSSSCFFSSISSCSSIFVESSSGGTLSSSPSSLLFVVADSCSSSFVEFVSSFIMDCGGDDAVAYIVSSFASIVGTSSSFGIMTLDSSAVIICFSSSFSLGDDNGVISDSGYSSSSLNSWFVTTSSSSSFSNCMGIAIDVSLSFFGFRVMSSDSDALSCSVDSSLGVL
mmetsp:Transcript_31564/g.41924  ORF Transcript_31564/g.41924 Transcript_31564/m.41924 type:complete len:230 (+) Transcript_31564:868-1557(+)